jgi:hypothetical protein
MSSTRFSQSVNSSVSLFLPKIFRLSLAALASVVLLHGMAASQILLNERSYDPAARTQAVSGASQLNSNSIGDIIITGSTIWLGTARGLSRSTDGGVTWKSYYNTLGFGTEEISALAVHNNEVWAATSHSQEVNNESDPVGTGLHYSSDGGETWQHFPQPKEDTDHNVDTLYYNAFSVIRALGITTEVNNITYDIAVTDSAVWIASFAGMARKSTDHGKTWQRVILPPDWLNEINPKDTLHFDLSPASGKIGLAGNYNHRVFSVMAENNQTIWIGTAGGVNRSTDGGVSWTKFNHQNQTSPISGNFVVALAKQASSSMIWAATVNTDNTDEKRGISFSADSGATWKTALLGVFVHGIGFNGDIVYALTDHGIFRSADFGASWSATGTLYDAVSMQRMVAPEFYTAVPQGTTIWFGGNQGIARTVDDGINPFGFAWTILRTSQALASKSDTYAYPNPFSPDDEVVRIHYSSAGTGATTSSTSAAITIRVFDFSMHLVRTLIQNAPRFAARELDEIWDGKDNNRNQVANGVYFYQVIVNNNDPIWGKILALQ